LSFKEDILLHYFNMAWIKDHRFCW